MENPWGLVGDAASDRARGHLHEREARWSRGRAGRRRRWHHHAGLWARRRWRARPIAAWLAGTREGRGWWQPALTEASTTRPVPAPSSGRPSSGRQASSAESPAAPARRSAASAAGPGRSASSGSDRSSVAGSPPGTSTPSVELGAQGHLVAGPLEELVRAVDAASELDLNVFSDEGLRTLLRGLQSQMDRLAALRAKVTGDLTARAAAAAPKGREASAAQRSRQFLHEELNLSPSEAKNTTETGRKLRGAPDTANRFGSAQFGQAHAKVITDPPPRSTRYTVRSWKRCYWTRPARSTRSSSDGSRDAKWPAATRPRQRKRRNVATNAGPARWFRVRTEACTFEPACTRPMRRHPPTRRPRPGTASKLTPPRGGDDTVIVGDVGVDEDVRHRYRSGADGELGSGAEGGRETAPAFGVPRRPSSPVLL